MRGNDHGQRYSKTRHDSNSGHNAACDRDRQETGASTWTESAPGLAAIRRSTTALQGIEAEPEAVGPRGAPENQCM